MSLFAALRELEAMHAKAREAYEAKIEQLTNERDLYRCTAADLQSQLDRERANRGMQSTKL